jgi:hypothetical protein
MDARLARAGTNAAVEVRSEARRRREYAEPVDLPRMLCLDGERRDEEGYDQERDPKAHGGSIIGEALRDDKRASALDAWYHGLRSPARALYPPDALLTS